MSKRHELQRRISSLREISSIMDSMNNIALMEMRKLDRSYKMQQRVVESISRALNDVRCHFTDTPLVVDAPPIYLLFGTERGFCGAYNEQLVELLVKQPGYEHSPVVGVGSHLEGPLQRGCPDAVCLRGAAIADEVDPVLESLVGTINRLRKDYFPSRLEVIHFEPNTHQALCEPILPPLSKSSGGNIAPLINLDSGQLFTELLDHYLFAITHAWFFAALLAENQRRVQHLQQAGDHLERRLDELFKRSNMIRQEEIIEEIEVILLSAELVSPLGMLEY